MKKDVLEKAINELGIFDGDVIKIPNDEGVDYYQYKNGVFKYLSNDCMEMEDCEVHELISGECDFEIVARGENPFIDSLEEQVSRIDCTVDSINDTVDNIDNEVEVLSKTINRYINDIEFDRAEKEKQDRIVGYIFGFGILAMAILSLIIKLF